MKRFLISVAVICAALAGCAVGPDYRAPGAGSSLADKNWVNPLPHGGKVANLAAWWDQFDDPVMTLLIERAEKNSPTLDIALANINQARASLEKSGAGVLPNVSAGASGTRSKSGGGTSRVYRTSRMADLDAAWEIDLFGGKRRAIEQATAQLEAQEAKWHDARITLAAEVADAYIGLRACENTLVIMKSRVASQNETRKLVSFKSQAGLTPVSDEDLSAASALNTESALENQKGQCALQMNQLSYLTGIAHDDLSTLTGKRTAMVPRPASAEIDAVPARVIEQRPDVAAAERALAAASAAIGVADAAQYPGLSLGGTLAVSASSLAGPVTTWSFGPALSLPIFNGGALRAESKRTRAAFDQAVGNYKLAVRTAAREVEDALARLSAANSRIAQSEEAVNKYRQYLKSVEASYASGSANLLDLEETRRTVYSAEESMIATRQEMAGSWIALYKAIGGGWDNPAKEATHDKQ